MLSQAKETIRDCFRPAARRIRGVNPNTLTLLGLALGIIAAFLFAGGKEFAGGIFVLLSGILDILDGAVAKENSRITRFGGFLDSVCDRYGDAAILLGAMYGAVYGYGGARVPVFPDIQWFWGAVALVGSFMVSYTRARAEAAGGEAPLGIGERGVRMLIITGGALTGFLNYAIFIVAILSHLTVVQRILFVRKNLL